MLGPRRVLEDSPDTQVSVAFYQRAAKLARAHGACSPIQAVLWCFGEPGAVPAAEVPGFEGPQQLVPSASSPSHAFWSVAAWCWQAIKGKWALLRAKLQAWFLTRSPLHGTPF